VNINYRFPGAYIESNLATVRNTPVLTIGNHLAVIQLIVTMDGIAKHVPIGIIFEVAKSSVSRHIPHQTAAFFAANTPARQLFLSNTTAIADATDREVRETAKHQPLLCGER
jgi:hypothetical protein